MPPGSNFPRTYDRLSLGDTGLEVSPICLGMTSSAESVVAAFDAGVNFFFVSADLHWPLYRELRQGLTRLLSVRQVRRSKIVVAAVSYLDEHMFREAGQFMEVIQSIPGLNYLDILIAGASTSGNLGRLAALHIAKAAHFAGTRGVGATFHDRAAALSALNADNIDIGLIRYNTHHPKAAAEVLSNLRPGRRNKVYGFKSVMWPVTEDQYLKVRPSDRLWRPDVTDCYRFALSTPGIDGILCSPRTPEEVASLVRSLERGALDTEAREYMIRLSSLCQTGAADRLSEAWDGPGQGRWAPQLP